jgi:hypothetical protein
MDKPQRSGCPRHKDERREHASSAQSRACGRSDQRRAVGADFQPSDEGDTSSLHTTLQAAQTELKRLKLAVEEVVADKGYHSGAVLTELHGHELRSYIPEPDRGRRNWQGEGKAEEQKRTYENRGRVRGDPNKRLQKLRSELTERNLAHLYETGGMRRLHLRDRDNILKRLLVQGAAFNLSLILRKTMGVGKLRRLQGTSVGLIMLILRLLYALSTPRAASAIETPCSNRLTAANLNSFVNCLCDNPITQFSVQWILNLNYLSQFWGPLQSPLRWNAPLYRSRYVGIR